MNLTLHLTAWCNMDCTYCITEKAQRRMTDEVLYAACDLAFSQGKTAGICFFGGEPLLEEGLIRKAIAYCQEKSRQTGMPFHCKMTTNGTLLTEDFLRLARQVGMTIGISFDGCVQDACRFYADGSKTGAHMTRNAKMLLRYLPNSLAMATIAPECAGQYTDTVTYLYELGFRRIHLTPAYGKRVHWTEQTLEILCKELEKIADIYKAQIIAGHPLQITTLDAKISDCILGRNPDNRCHLGLRQMPVDTDGTLYPCTQFIGDPDFRLGDVFHGVDKTLQLALLQQHRQMPTECRQCALRNRCTNGCGCLNRMETGDMHQVSPLQCGYEQGLIAACDRMAEALYAEAPAQFLRHFGKK